MPLKIGFHSPFGPNFTLEFGNLDPKKLGQAYCSSVFNQCACCCYLLTIFKRQIFNSSSYNLLEIMSIPGEHCRVCIMCPGPVFSNLLSIAHTERAGEVRQRNALSMHTALQSVMNFKISKQRFWPCHKNLLIKTIPTIYTAPYAQVSK